MCKKGFRFPSRRWCRRRLRVTDSPNSCCTTTSKPTTSPLTRPTARPANPSTPSSAGRSSCRRTRRSVVLVPVDPRPWARTPPPWEQSGSRWTAESGLRLLRTRSRWEAALRLLGRSLECAAWGGVGFRSWGLRRTLGTLPFPEGREEKYVPKLFDESYIRSMR